MAVIDQDNFYNISWNSDQRAGEQGSSANPGNATTTPNDSSNKNQPKMADDSSFDQPLSPGGAPRQKQKQRQRVSGADLEGHDPTVLGPEILQCRVSSPLTENEGGSNPFTSYLVTTNVRRGSRTGCILVRAVH